MATKIIKLCKTPLWKYYFTWNNITLAENYNLEADTMNCYSAAQLSHTQKYSDKMTGHNTDDTAIHRCM